MNETEKTQLWKRRFFEAQAAAEEFVTSRYGQLGIDQWIDANSTIAARLLGVGTTPIPERWRDFSERLFNQLQLYESDISIVDEPTSRSLINKACGILSYRKAAEARGVKLTFKSPCDYCKALNTGIYEKYTENNTISVELKTDGCVWKISHT